MSWKKAYKGPFGKKEAEQVSKELSEALKQYGCMVEIRKRANKINRYDIWVKDL